MLAAQQHVWHLLPVLLIIFVFGVGLLLRLTTSVGAPIRDYGYQPRVSVLLPVFNEGAHVLETIESILATHWPRDRLEIVAIDDCSADDSWDYLERAAKRYPDVIRLMKNPVNSGKHVSLSHALQESSGEIVICIDSDCIFDKNVIRELVACFCDPKVGAVGGHIGITNVNDNTFTLCQALVYFMSFQVGKMLQSVQRRVFCISGCLFAVRRHVFMEVEESVRGRNWFGMKVRDGEDRYMTHAILMRGWHTLVNPAAVCWTAAPTRLGPLFGQQLRWRRSGLRDLFWTLARMPQHFRVMGVTPLFTALIPELFTVLWALYLFTAVPLMGVGEAIRCVVLALLTFCSMFIVWALAYNRCIREIAVGSEPIINPLKAGLAGAWFFMDSMLITLLALLTFDVGSWGTRDKVEKRQALVGP